MSKSSSLRIVLVDPLGDVLFSGESLSMLPSRLADEAPVAEAEEERCPATLRSATVTHESGIYRSSAYVHDGGPETLPEYPLSAADEIRGSRTRAA